MMAIMAGMITMIIMIKMILMTVKMSPLVGGRLNDPQLPKT